MTVFCRTGHRASMAASILEAAGAEVRLVAKGGAKDWPSPLEPVRGRHRRRRGGPAEPDLLGPVDALRRIFAGATAGPDLPPDDGDLQDVTVLGLRVPICASVAILATTAIIVLDQLGWLLPFSYGFPDPSCQALDPITVQRFALFLVVPARDRAPRLPRPPESLRPRARRLALGHRPPDRRPDRDAADHPRAVVPRAVPGLLRRRTGRPVAGLVVEHALELVPAEFLLRGFLMFTLWRRIGPLALVVQLLPFVLTHVGKPEIELWSTFIGGSVFGWLNWRTGSILWSAIGHVYVLTLMELAVGGTPV